MKKTIIFVFLTVIIYCSSFGQSYFQKGRTYLGPTVGISWGMGIGVTGEYGISETFGCGGEVLYSSFSDWSMIGFAFYGSYHFTPRKSFDPFIKLGFGYYNFKFSGLLIDEGTNYASGIGLSGATGFHYWFSSSSALRLQVGWPFLLGLGFDFKIGGK